LSSDDPFVGFNTVLDGSTLRVGVVVSRFNRSVTSKLLDGARYALSKSGVLEEAVQVVSVPGALEIPLVAKKMAESGSVDAIVALGCVIRGETTHYELVAEGSANGIARIALDTGVPITNGILATENVKQADERSGGKRGNVGHNAALAAVEIALLIRKFDTDDNPS